MARQNNCQQWRILPCGGDSVVVTEGVAANPTINVDVDVRSGAVFGNVEGHDAYINMLSIDGGALMAYENPVARAVGGSIHINGLEIGSGGMAVKYDGAAYEGLAIDDFITWDAANGDAIRAALADAVAAGNITLTDENGVQYAIDDIDFDGDSLSVVYGAAVPEPAAAAILLGVLSLAFAAYRRKN